MNRQLNKLKILTLITFTLIAPSTYGINEKANLVSIKNESTLREVETNDSIKHIDYSKREKQTAKTDNLKSTKQPSAEFSIGVFSGGGLNTYLTSWRQIKPWFSFGMGLGLRQYFNPKLTLVPIFVDLKANLSTKKVSPFLSCKAGYSLGGRFLFNPRVGLGIKTSNKNSLNIGIGYEMQQIGTSYYGRRTDNSIGANIGFQF